MDDCFLRKVLLWLRKELVRSRLEEQVAVSVAHLRPEALLDQLMHLLTSRAALHSNETGEQSLHNMHQRVLLLRFNA